MFSSGLKGEKSGMDRAERSPEVQSIQTLAQPPPCIEDGVLSGPYRAHPEAAPS